MFSFEACEPDPLSLVPGARLSHNKPVLVPNSLVRPSHESKPEIVAIGVSTGGPNALAEIFPNLVIHFTLVMNQAILGLALLAAKTESVERRFSKTSGGVH